MSKTNKQTATPPVEGNTPSVNSLVPEAFLELLKPFQKEYPQNAVFYVTTDRQVFLAATHNEAAAHQATLTGELVTIGAPVPATII